jgi:hypothetical protein
MAKKHEAGGQVIICLPVLEGSVWICRKRASASVRPRGRRMGTPVSHAQTAYWYLSAPGKKRLVTTQAKTSTSPRWASKRTLPPQNFCCPNAPPLSFPSPAKPRNATKHSTTTNTTTHLENIIPSRQLHHIHSNLLYFVLSDHVAGELDSQ